MAGMGTNPHESPQECNEPRIGGALFLALLAYVFAWALMFGIMLVLSSSAEFVVSKATKLVSNP
jgi:hypothetical protein